MTRSQLYARLVHILISHWLNAPSDWLTATIIIILRSLSNLTLAVTNCIDKKGAYVTSCSYSVIKIGTNQKLKYVYNTYYLNIFFIQRAHVQM